MQKIKYIEFTELNLENISFKYENTNIYNKEVNKLYKFILKVCSKLYDRFQNKNVTSTQEFDDLYENTMHDMLIDIIRNVEHHKLRFRKTIIPANELEEYITKYVYRHLAFKMKRIWQNKKSNAGVDSLDNNLREVMTSVSEEYSEDRIDSMLNSLRETIETFNEHEKNLLRLLMHEHKSSKEVSDILQIPIKQVVEQKHKIIQRLSKIYNNKENS